MTKEQALEKKLEQTKWQFPDHVVFKHKGKVYHFDPSNFSEDSIFSQTGLKVYKRVGNVALYDPEYFKVATMGDLEYKGIATEKIPQPINLKQYNYMFSRCECKTIDLSDWDFSEVVDMHSMFSHSGIKTMILGDANFIKCRYFDDCFYCCIELQELLLGNYRVLQDANVYDMFHSCKKLSEKHNKAKEELADIFKSGQWNSLQQVKKMGAF